MLGYTERRARGDVEVVRIEFQPPCWKGCKELDFTGNVRVAIAV